jgi:NDP-sugar pyrophosphorylase family protein
MLSPASEAAGRVLGEDVRIVDGVRFGAQVVDHDDTMIGDGCVIEDGGGAVVHARPHVARLLSACLRVRCARWPTTSCSSAGVSRAWRTRRR